MSNKAPWTIDDETAGEETMRVAGAISGCLDLNVDNLLSKQNPGSEAGCHRGSVDTQDGLLAMVRLLARRSTWLDAYTTSLSISYASVHGLKGASPTPAVRPKDTAASPAADLHVRTQHQLARKRKRKPLKTSGPSQGRKHRSKEKQRSKRRSKALRTSISDTGGAAMRNWAEASRPRFPLHNSTAD